MKKFNLTVLSLILVILSLFTACSSPSTILETPIKVGEAPAIEVGKGLSTGEKIIKEAERIFDHITYTEYQHTTDMNEETGRYITDCSGFVDYVLKRVAPENYAKLPLGGHQRPLAENIYDYIAAKDYLPRAPKGDWCQVTLDTAEAGDIIVYKNTEEAQEEKDNTGHVMIIYAKPDKQLNGDYLVWIIDSTSILHGNDTRKDSPKGTTGIGKGKMYYGGDAFARPIYFRWKDADGYKNRDDLEGIAIGRAG